MNLKLWMEGSYQRQIYNGYQRHETWLNVNEKVLTEHVLGYDSYS